MEVLMLKNQAIYNITDEAVLLPNLCPFDVNGDVPKNLATWKKNRAYLASNRIAERVVALAGGENTLEAKRRLSLSDSFWIKHDNDNENCTNGFFDHHNSFTNGYCQNITISGKVLA